MADAKRCDRCKQFYEIPPSMSVITVDDDRKFDLCSTCIKSFETFLNNEADVAPILERTPWRGRKDESFYFIEYDGLIYSESEGYLLEFCNTLYKFGNYFETKGHAQQVLELIYPLFKTGSSWKPLYSTHFWYVNCYGKVARALVGDADVNWVLCLRRGNCFRTEREAEQRAQQVKSVLREFHKNVINEEYKTVNDLITIT